MPLNVKEDETSPPGNALVDLGVTVPKPARLSIRRVENEPHHLGRGGWQPEVAWLDLPTIQCSATSTIVRAGPSIVGRIDELELIEIVLEGGRSLGTCRWPAMARPPIDFDDLGPAMAVRRKRLQEMQTVPEPPPKAPEPVPVVPPELMPAQPTPAGQKDEQPIKPRRSYSRLIVAPVLVLVPMILAGGFAAMKTGYIEWPPTTRGSASAVSLKPSEGELKARLADLIKRSVSDDEYVALGKEALAAGYGMIAFNAFDQANSWSNEEAAWEMARFRDPLVTDPVHSQIPNRQPQKAYPYYAKWKAQSQRHMAALKALCDAYPAIVSSTPEFQRECRS